MAPAVVELNHTAMKATATQAMALRVLAMPQWAAPMAPVRTLQYWNLLKATKGQWWLRQLRLVLLSGVHIVIEEKKRERETIVGRYSKTILLLHNATLFSDIDTSIN